MLKLMYITNNIEVAKIAQEYGVDWIFVDLETLGKAERQGNMDSVKSHHTTQDVAKLRPFLNKAKLLVRVNPINATSEQEVNTVIKNGADIVMLPMYKTNDEVKQFIKLVNGRAKVMLLLETKEAHKILDATLKIKGIDYIHIGINDLHLSYKKKFMFELFVDGIVDDICEKIKKTQIPYGIGGIAGLGKGMIPAERIIREHYRLGSSMAILSRSFCNTDKEKDLSTIKKVFEDGLQGIREFEMSLEKYSTDDFVRNHQDLDNLITNIF